MMRAGAPSVKNPPRTPRLGLVDGPLSHYLDKSYRLALVCGSVHCNKADDFWPDELMDILGAKATISDVESRMICGECGHSIDGIHIAWARRTE